jgi:hypothetical protein
MRKYKIQKIEGSKITGLYTKLGSDCICTPFSIELPSKMTASEMKVYVEQLLEKMP